MTDSARAEILATPLRQNISSSGDINGALFNADFLTQDDFVRTPTRLNASNQSANLVAKIDVNTTETTSLTFGATGAFGRNNEFDRGRSHRLGKQQPDDKFGLAWLRQVLSAICRRRIRTIDRGLEECLLLHHGRLHQPFQARRRVAR